MKFAPKDWRSFIWIIDACLAAIVVLAVIRVAEARAFSVAWNSAFGLCIMLGIRGVVARERKKSEAQQAGPCDEKKT